LTGEGADRLQGVYTNWSCTFSVTPRWAWGQHLLVLWGVTKTRHLPLTEQGMKMRLKHCHYWQHDENEALSWHDWKRVWNDHIIASMDQYKA